MLYFRIYVIYIMLYIHFHLEQHPQVRVPNLTHARCSWCQEVTPAEFAAYMQFHYRSLTTRSICLVLFIAVCRARRFGHVQPVKFWTCLLDPFFPGSRPPQETLPRGLRSLALQFCRAPLLTAFTGGGHFGGGVTNGDAESGHWTARKPLGLSEKF